jgi:hypothetical protein
MDLRVGAYRGIPNRAIRADPHARAQMHPAHQDRIHVDEHIGAHLHLAAHVDPLRIRERRSGAHQFLGARATVMRLGLRELNLVVDPRGFRRIRGEHCLHAAARAHGRGHDVGEEVFALRIVIAQGQQPFAQLLRGHRHQPGVDLLNRQLLRRRVAMLDDRPDLAGGAAHDAPIAARIRPASPTIVPLNPGPRRPAIWSGSARAPAARRRTAPAPVWSSGISTWPASRRGPVPSCSACSTQSTGSELKAACT